MSSCLASDSRLIFFYGCVTALRLTAHTLMSANKGCLKVRFKNIKAKLPNCLVLSKELYKRETERLIFLKS